MPNEYTLGAVPSENQLIFDISKDDPFIYICNIAKSILDKEPKIHPMELSEYCDSTKPFFIIQSSFFINDKILNLAKPIILKTLVNIHILDKHTNNRHLEKILNVILRNFKIRVINTIVYNKYKLDNDKYKQLPQKQRHKILDIITEMLDSFKKLQLDFEHKKSRNIILNRNRHYFLTPLGRLVDVF